MCSDAAADRVDLAIRRRPRGPQLSFEPPVARRSRLTPSEMCYASVLSEGERDVVPTESKRIVDCVLIVAGPSTAVDDVQVDLGVLVLQVERRRDDAVPQGQNGEDGLHRTDRTDRMAERRLWCVHRGPVGAERVVDRDPFRNIADRGA